MSSWLYLVREKLPIDGQPQDCLAMQDGWSYNGKIVKFIIKFNSSGRGTLYFSDEKTKDIFCYDDVFRTSEYSNEFIDLLISDIQDNLREIGDNIKRFLKRNPTEDWDPYWDEEEKEEEWDPYSGYSR